MVFDTVRFVIVTANVQCIISYEQPFNTNVINNYIIIYNNNNCNTSRAPMSLKIKLRGATNQIISRNYKRGLAKVVLGYIVSPKMCGGNDAGFD